MIDPQHLAGYGMLSHWMNPPTPADPSKTITKTENVYDDKGNGTHIVEYGDGSFDEQPLTAKGRSDKFGAPAERVPQAL